MIHLWFVFSPAKYKYVAASCPPPMPHPRPKGKSHSVLAIVQPSCSSSCQKPPILVLWPPNPPYLMYIQPLSTPMAGPATLCVADATFMNALNAAQNCAASTDTRRDRPEDMIPNAIALFPKEGNYWPSSPPRRGRDGMPPRCPPRPRPRPSPPRPPRPR